MKSISKTLTLSQLAVSLFAITLFCGALYYYIEKMVSDEVNEGLLRQADTLSQMVEMERGRIEFEFDEFKFEEFNGDGSTASYFFFNADGKIVNQSRFANLELLPDIEKMKNHLSSIEEDGTTESYAKGFTVTSDERYSTFVIYPFYPRVKKSEGGAQGRWYVAVTRDQTNFRTILSSLVWGSVVCGVVFVILNLIFQFWAIRRGLQPLREIGAQVENLDAANLHDRLSTERLPYELLPITLRLNDLLDRLEKSFVHERSFSSSAAHELRTPLAELKTIMQVGEGLSVGDDPSEYFTDAESVIVRMQSLMSALLTLVEADASEFQPHWVSVDMVHLVSTEFKKAKEAHPAHLIHWQAPKELFVTTDIGLLQGVVRNLVVNALEYSDPDMKIEMNIDHQDGVASFSIVNECRDIQAEDLDLMCDAFWRKDTARAGATHFGLGLTLIKTYVKCLDLGLAITQPDKDRIKFEITGIKTV